MGPLRAGSEGRFLCGTDTGLRSEEEPRGRASSRKRTPTVPGVRGRGQAKPGKVRQGRDMRGLVTSVLSRIQLRSAFLF